MHFLKKSERPSEHGPRGLSRGQPWACVNVMVKGATLVVQPGIAVAKADVQFWPIPARVAVVSDEGEVIQPSRGRVFYVSVETFDPYHLVMEASESDMSGW